jgi:anti-sigma regulatory factor (Ser/Thr protein kinase)
MVFNPHRSIILSDKNYLSIIKKDLKVFAEGIGFTGAKLGSIEIIVAEMTSNLFKHANKGRELLFKEVQKNGHKGIEIIALDDGPGMKDPHVMQRDGFSTTKTLGQGLGAIKRLSHEYDLYSTLGWGTIIVSRFYMEHSDNYKHPETGVDVRAVVVPKPGEIACGDGWAYRKDKGSFSILIMDGLGHGLLAEAAAQAAINTFLTIQPGTPNELLVEIHNAIRKTRGGVGAILQLYSEKKNYIYCGLGNIAARCINLFKVRTLLSYNGIIGMNKPARLHNQEHELDGKDIFVITSDGIKTRWDHSLYPGILTRDGSIFAAAIYKDQSRRTDDSMVIIAKVKTIV